MTIFGENHVYLPNENGTLEFQCVGQPTKQALNYVFFGSFTLNFVITGIVNPVVLWLRLKSASNSIPSFITCFLMVSDLVTNIYFPILWNYKLLRKNPKDSQTLLPSSIFEVFNTCLLEIVSLLSVFYLAALSFLLKRKVKDPLNPVSVVKTKRIIIGGTIFVAVSVTTVFFFLMIAKPGIMFFSKYTQKVEDLSSTSITYLVFLILRIMNITCIINFYLEIAYILIRKRGMGETREQTIKGGKVAAAMSFGAIVGFILVRVEESTREDANIQNYLKFVLSCFLPSMLATYNSFIQVTLVKDVRDVFSRKEQVNVLHQNTEVLGLSTHGTECSIQENIVALQDISNQD